MSLIDPRNGAEWDLPPFAGEARTYVVASTPRTGSTLLCRSLWDTRRAAAPKEYLNPMQLRDWEVRLGATRRSRLAHRALFGPAVALAGRTGWGESDLRTHLERVRARRTGADGLFGLKLHRHHFEYFFGTRGFSWQKLLAPRLWIRIRREDRVAQAVSWARALQSGRWAAHQRSVFPAIYRRGQIVRLEAAIEEMEAAWDEFFAAEGIEPLSLSYEELVRDRTASLRAVLAFLEVEDAASVAVPPAELEAQADGRSAAWIRRYRAGS